MRLIDADELISRIPECDIDHDEKISKVGAIADMICMIMDSQTIERKNGKWVKISDKNEDGNAWYNCSICHCGESHAVGVKVNYCWNCGAKMEGE